MELISNGESVSSEPKEEYPLLETNSTQHDSGEKRQSKQQSTRLKSATCNRCLGKLVSFLKSNALLVLTFCGVLIGFAVGFGIQPMKPPDSTLLWLGLPGEVFMRLLKVTILPLIVASIISGTASLDPRSNGRISVATVVYCLCTNTVGVVVGLIVYYVINPGQSVTTASVAVDSGPTSRLETPDIFADMIRNFFPDNVITACFQKTQTTYKTITITVLQNGANVTLEEYARSVGTASGTNILGIIIVCTAVGIATGKAGEVGRPFVQFFNALSEIIILLLKWLIWFTPVGVFSLIATSVARTENLETTFHSFAMFVLAVVVMVIFLNVLLFPGVYFLAIRRNPLSFLLSALRPMMSGFAPPSSAIAIPDVLNIVETKHDVDIRISRFCVPFGAALSRVGSGGFILMCSLFLTRLEGATLHAGQVIHVVILSIMSTFAVPAVPSASVLCVIIVLSSVNVVSTNIGIIMALEWLVDRLRTTSNVMGNFFCSIFISRLCKNNLVPVAMGNKVQGHSSIREVKEMACDINIEVGDVK